MTETSERTDQTEERVDQLERENEQLRERLAALEAQVAESTDGQSEDTGADTDDRPGSTAAEFNDRTDSTGADTDTDGRPESMEADTGAPGAVPELLTSGGQPAKVIGKLDNENGIGVFGDATGTGTTRGVLGTTPSSDGVGVLGEASSTSGQIYGVKGVSDSTDDDAAGVRGEATAGSGTTYGVDAETKSISNDAAGVRGRATGTTGQIYGVAGLTDSDDNGAAGLRGQASASSGTTYGVHGETQSSDDGAAGVWAENDSAPSSVARGLKVSGYRDVSQTTLSVFLASAQDIPNSSVTAVEFDGMQSNDWTSSEYDSSTGTFSVPASGRYHVSTTVRFAVASNFSDSDVIALLIAINGDYRAINEFTVPSSNSDIPPHLHVSRTLTGLDTTDDITVRAFQDSGEPRTLLDDQAMTYMTIDKIG
jgi:hypothetical protein